MGTRPEETGVCPHCRVAVRFEIVDVWGRGVKFGAHPEIGFTTKSGHVLRTDAAGCPACGRVIVTAAATSGPKDAHFRTINVPLWPDAIVRPLPNEVEAEAPELAGDFQEAV